MVTYFRGGIPLRLRVRRRLLAVAPRSFWLIAACFTLVSAMYADFVPMWDGWVYSDECILRAIDKPFSLSSYNCFGHPSIAYTYPMGVLQQLDRGNLALLHIGPWLLGLLAIYSFYRVSEKMFEGWQSVTERGLLTAVFAFMPLFACNCINPNPDFAVLVYTLALLWALLWNRTWLQLLFGLCLAFCKETGIMLYVICVGTHFVLHLPRPLLHAGHRVSYLLRHSHLAVPVVVFWLYLRHMRLTPSHWGIHSSREALDLLRSATSFSLLDKCFLSYTYGALASNFNWVLSLLILAYLVKWAWCRCWGAPHPVQKRQVLAFVILLAAFLAVTRYKTYSNYRYVCVTGPLLVLAAYWSLLRLFQNRRVRVALLSVVLFFVGVSNWRTIDPIPKRFLYGTFKFGAYDMLPVGLSMGDFPFPGLDQLQYNFEYTHLHDALNEVYASIDPEKSLFVIAHNAEFGLLTRVDKKERRRTLRVKNTVWPQFVEVSGLPNRTPKPDTIHYIAFPHMGEALKKSNLAELRANYDIKETRRFGKGGYFMEVYVMTRKGG